MEDDDKSDLKNAWFSDPTTVSFRKELQQKLIAAENTWRSVSQQSSDPAVRAAYEAYVTTRAFYAGLGGNLGKR